MIAYLLLGIITWLQWYALMGIGQFIYDYQTLITGFAALGAAYVAVRPVYRQLALMQAQSAMMQTQSNGVLRDMLLQRKEEIEQADAALSENVGKRLKAIAGEFPWYDEDFKPDEPMAHNYDQVISGAVSWLRLKYQWRDNPVADGKKAALIEALDKLISILSDVHAPAHTDQVGEDYAMSDEDWEKFNARGEEAKGEVYGAVIAAQKSLQGYGDSFRDELAAIRSQLLKLDQTLLPSPR